MDSDDIIAIGFMLLIVFIFTMLLIVGDNTHVCERESYITNEYYESKPLNNINVYKDTECIHNDLTGEVWCVREE